MEPLKRVLVERLVSKGLDVTYIPAFVRNVSHSIAEDSFTDLPDLNRRMQILGWDGFEMDYYTFNLIIATLQWDSGAFSPYRVESVSGPGEDLTRN